jgi:hypothetical protein
VRYVLVADFFAEDTVGGGGTHSGGAELSDEILYSILKSKGEDVFRIRSRYINENFLNDEKDSLFILSNFFHIHPSILERFYDLNYCLIAHDYKFVAHTQPNLYKDFLVPKHELINTYLFHKAKATICQSSFQAAIHKKNLEVNNIINFSGNLWSNETLELMSQFSKNEKKKVYSVVKSPYKEKGVPEAIKFCIENKLDYELVYDKNHNDFLKKISLNEGVVFWSKVPETCGRICVEAKMMNCIVHTNEMLGASYEPWFNLQGEELINVMKQKHQEIHKIITSL